MGHREMRRVPLDFNWELNKVWEGYIMDCDSRLCSDDFWDNINPIGDKDKWEMYYKHKAEIHDPPTGEGYQLWETVSEGSPISPVFDTMEKLAVWAEENATTFAWFKITKENWMKMFQDNHIQQIVKFGDNITGVF